MPAAASGARKSSRVRVRPPLELLADHGDGRGEVLVRQVEGAAVQGRVALAHARTGQRLDPAQLVRREEVPRRAHARGSGRSRPRRTPSRRPRRSCRAAIRWATAHIAPGTSCDWTAPNQRTTSTADGSTQSPPSSRLARSRAWAIARLVTRPSLRNAPARTRHASGRGLRWRGDPSSRHLCVVPRPRAAALGPAAAVARRGRPARARRAPVHRHPPGLRAVVQAARPRADRGPADPRGGRHGHDAPPPQPGPEDPQDPRRPDRRPRDDDPAPVHVLPGSPGVGVRLPVRAVPARSRRSSGGATRRRRRRIRRARPGGRGSRRPSGGGRCGARSCAYLAARGHALADDVLARDVAPAAGAGRAGSRTSSSASIAPTPTRRWSPNGSSTSTRASRSGGTAT